MTKRTNRNKKKRKTVKKGGAKQSDFTIGDEPYKKDWYNNINILSCYIEKKNFKHFIKYLLLKSKVKSINFLKRFKIIKKMYRQLTRILR